MKLDHTVRRLGLALIASLAFSSSAWAQAWPAKPIRLVVNFAPGGAADVIARALGPQLSQALKQPVVIDNKPGAGGNLGSGEVAKSPNDGYTLLMSSGGAITINPLIYSKMGFDPEKDLVSVAAVARVLVFLETNPSLPVGNVQEFITYARANPGKLSFGSPGQGSSPARCSSAWPGSRRPMCPTRARARPSLMCWAGSCSSGSTRAPASST